MEMNKSYVQRKEDRAPQWRVIDAKDQVLGRLATEVTDILRGKDKPSFTPHIDTGDYVVIINCDKIILTGKKWTDKMYRHHTGWMGGLKERTALEMFKKDPSFLIKQAVRGMLPKNRLARQILKKLRVYTGDTHPHAAQV